MTSLVALLLLAVVAAAHDHAPAPPVVDEVIDWDTIELHHKLHTEKPECKGGIQANIFFDYKDNKYVKKLDDTDMFYECNVSMDVFSPKGNRLLYFHFVVTKQEGEEEPDENTTEPVFANKLVTEETHRSKLIEYAKKIIEEANPKADLVTRISKLPSIKVEYEKFIKEKAGTIQQSQPKTE